MPDRTYVMFSHTIKAQPYNMPLLDAINTHRARLIDYECITEVRGGARHGLQRCTNLRVQGGKRGGKRLVAFGRFAGLAGSIDFIRGLGERFLSLGYSTPLLAMGSTYM